MGDACDSQAGVANRFLYFDPLTGDSQLQASGIWTMEFDRWLYADDVNPSQLILDTPLTDVDVWVGVDIDTRSVSGVQVALIIRDPGGAPYYYGELFDAGTSPHLSITHFDGSTYNALSVDPIAAFPSGAITVHLTARGGATPTFDYQLLSSTESRTTTSPAPGYTGGGFLLIGFGNNSGAVRYVAIVGT